MAFTEICFIVLLTAILSSPFASCVLVPSPPLHLHYHKGPLLAGHGPLKLHLTFYGHFSALEKNTIKSFLHSLSDTPPSYIAHFPSHKKASLQHTATRLSPPPSSSPELPPLLLQRSSSSSSAERLPAASASSSKFSADPTVAKWWSLTRAYTDTRGNGVSQSVLLQHEASNHYSHGKLLSHSTLASLARISARRASAEAVSHAAGAEQDVSLHLILTAPDVAVEGFCMHSCGQHSHTESDLKNIVYAWVGNARAQCPGYCSWPFVRAEFGPDVEPLKAPNDPSTDGMIINLAKVLVEAATNPLGNGYYLGGDSHGMGVSSVCTGAYGDGAYPGYPGCTLEDPVTGASFNARGLTQQAKFLLPYIWNPLTLSCAVQPN